MLNIDGYGILAFAFKSFFKVTHAGVSLPVIFVSISQRYDFDV